MRVYRVWRKDSDRESALENTNGVLVIKGFLT